MKLYENIFTDSELSKLTNFVSDLRTSGQTGELSGRPVRHAFPLHFAFTLLLIAVILSCKN